MRTRAAACIALTTVMLLAVSAVAFGARYEGGGAEDPRVGVTFAKDGDKVKGFTIKAALFRCTDGDRFRGGTRVGIMKIEETSHGRRFRGVFENADSTQRARVSGRVVRPGVARGEFRLLAFFDRVACDSRQVAWRARIR